LRNESFSIKLKTESASKQTEPNAVVSDDVQNGPLLATFTSTEPAGGAGIDFEIIVSSAFVLIVIPQTEIFSTNVA